MAPLAALKIALLMLAVDHTPDPNAHKQLIVNEAVPYHVRP